jgi:hypothetical protein
MAAMHPIEITDSSNAATMSRCKIVQTSYDVHGTSFLKAFFKSVCRLKAFDYNERAVQVQVKITFALALPSLSPNDALFRISYSS